MSIVFSFPGYEKLTERIRDQIGFSRGDFTLTSFPDGETLVTLQTDVKDQDVIVICGLDNPNEKIIPLLFFSHVAREMGAKRVGLIAPYLGYMRQDKQFNPGEVVSSKVFAKFLSSIVDWLVTVDPHLHRHKSLDEIYTIPTTVIHAAPLIGDWIKNNIENSVLIGPDEESRQWVEEVAQVAQAPYIVLKKTRHKDGTVEISVPDIDEYKKNTPVLVDDIISTAQTMAKTIEQLQKAGMKPPVCVGIHAIFAGDAYKTLKGAGAARVVTTNTIAHETNEIDVSPNFLQYFTTPQES